MLPQIYAAEDLIQRSDSEERVRKAADKLSKMVNAKQQGRLDGFFTVQAKAPSASKAGASGKRKVSVAGGWDVCWADILPQAEDGKAGVAKRIKGKK